jgi:YD repeat-containing protein
LSYYEYTEDFVLFEVELLEKIIEYKDKVVTDKIKIIRIVPPEEYEGFKVDNHGNIIYKNVDGIEDWYEYNEKNNCIHYKNSDGFEAWYEYNERNNCIHHKDSSGYEWWRKYDLNDNCIYSKHSNGDELWREYDANNNCIYSKHSNGNEWRAE